MISLKVSDLIPPEILESEHYKNQLLRLSKHYDLQSRQPPFYPKQPPYTQIQKEAAIAAMRLISMDHEAEAKKWYDLYLTLERMNDE